MASERSDMGNVRALHRVRVVLATHDRRFMRLAQFLLERSGFLVHCVRRLDEVVDAADRHTPDVVVLDAQDSLSAAARLSSAVESLNSAVRVIIVAEDDVASGVVGLRVLPKWASIEKLVEEIEQIYVDRQAPKRIAPGYW